MSFSANRQKQNCACSVIHSWMLVAGKNARCSKELDNLSQAVVRRRREMTAAAIFPRDISAQSGAENDRIIESGTSASQ